MTSLPRDRRYHGVAIAFHWIIAVLVIANLAIGVLHESLLKGTIPTHKAIGLTVLALTLGRIAWRLAHRPPPLPATVSSGEARAAHAVHWALYTLMVVMPLTGWMMVSGSAVKRPLTWFGLFDLPYLPVSAAAGKFGSQAHGVLGWLMLALVVLHVVAALRHHFLLRDATLVRMAPSLARSGMAGL